MPEFPSGTVAFIFTDIADIQAMFADPAFAATSPLVVAGWGQRPQG